jgi:hypothetical protein
VTAQIIKLSTLRRRRTKERDAKELAVLQGASPATALLSPRDERCEEAIAQLCAGMFRGYKDWTPGQVTFARDLFGKLHALFAAAGD